MEDKYKNMANGNLSSAAFSETNRNYSRGVIEQEFGRILEVLGIDWQNDPNTQNTPKRVAKMLVDEVLWGRFQPMPTTTTFPNTKKLDELYCVGPISVRSMCSHHFVPILGKCWIGVVPGKSLMGLSKFNRIVGWVMARPQIQEEATVQVADIIQQTIEPIGLAVVVKAQHMCVEWRGVKEPSMMTTSVMRGVMAVNPNAKREFFDLIREDK